VIGAEQFGEKQLAELWSESPVRHGGKERPHVVLLRGRGQRAGRPDGRGEHLAGYGHSRIAVLAGPDWLPYVHERIRGIRDVYREKGLPDPVVVHCPYDTADAIGAPSRSSCPLPAVTAIFVAAGDFVIGVLRACAELGRAVPRDLSVVCFDDHPSLQIFSVGHSGIPADRGDRRRGRGDALRADGGQEPPHRSVIIAPG